MNSLKCACPHGCDQPTGLPLFPGSALARHARCAMCAEPEHAAAWPIGALERTEAIRQHVSPLLEASEAERALQVAAHKEVADEIWAKQWAAWQASVPPKFRDATTAQPYVTERLRRLAAGQRGVASMVVFGPPGFGKTWVAVAYANAAIKAGHLMPSQVRFGSEAELLAAPANSGFRDVEVGLSKVTNPRVQMLILDDVGRGTWLNENMRPKVFSLVLDTFWAHNRILVLTTNLHPDRLTEYMGEGAMDRLRSLVGNAGLTLDSEEKRRKVTDEMLSAANQGATNR